MIDAARDERADHSSTEDENDRCEDKNW